MSDHFINGTLVTSAMCSGCGAPIAWLETVSPKGIRKAFPANVAPDPRAGNVAVNDGIAVVLTHGQAAGMRAANKPLYTSHFKSCPRADKFRKSTR